MSRNRITDVGIIVLSKSDLVYTLKKLNIDSTKVTDKCLQYIPSKNIILLVQLDNLMVNLIEFINLKFLSMKSSNVNFNKLSEIKINSVNVTISPSFELGKLNN